MQSQVLRPTDDPSLRAYVAWVPILTGDSAGPDAATRALVSDGRALHFWDAERALPPVFAQMLGLPEGWPAWDVYLAYPPGAHWDDEPPRPAFWHHQLGESLDAPVLDGAAFAAGVRELLGTA